MPKVLLNKELKMPQYFTEWLIIRMRRKKINQRKLGEVLHISQQAVGMKLRNNNYTFDEFITLTNYFEATEDDLISLTKV